MQCLVLALVLSAVPLLPVLAATQIDRSADTPDLLQTDPSAGLPFGGLPYCGPVSAANSMVWLSKHGYPKLAPEQNKTPRDLGHLALNLAREMKTTRAGGTAPSGFLRGLETYVTSKGYVIEKLRYQGWEEHPQKFSGGSELPTLSMLEQGIRNKNSAVWLMIGWYRYFPRKDKYIRIAGHWVTVVGMNDSTVTIHDSAPRSGLEPKHEQISFTRIDHGKILTGYDGMKLRNAAGFYKIGGELKVKENTDFGLLDGIIVLQLK